MGPEMIFSGTLSTVHSEQWNYKGSPNWMEKWKVEILSESGTSTGSFLLSLKKTGMSALIGFPPAHCSLNYQMAKTGPSAFNAIPLSANTGRENCLVISLHWNGASQFYTFQPNSLYHSLTYSSRSKELRPGPIYSPLQFRWWLQYPIFSRIFFVIPDERPYPARHVICFNLRLVVASILWVLWRGIAIAVAVLTLSTWSTSIRYSNAIVHFSIVRSVVGFSSTHVRTIWLLQRRLLFNPISRYFFQFFEFRKACNVFWIFRETSRQMSFNQVLVIHLTFEFG